MSIELERAAIERVRIVTRGSIADLERALGKDNPKIIAEMRKGKSV